jgi:hypothetical protein
MFADMRKSSMRGPQFQIPSVDNFGPGQPRRQGTAALASGSSVPTSGPFSQAHMHQYGRSQAPSRQYGSGAGARSQGAFAQAAAQQAGNQYRSTMEQANLQSQQNMEKVRSSDIYSQRADQVRRFGLDQGYEADRRGIQLSEQQDTKNIRNRLDEDRRNQQMNRQLSLLQGLVGGGNLMGAAADARISAQGGRSFMGYGGGGGGFLGGGGAQSMLLRGLTGGLV